MLAMFGAEIIQILCLKSRKCQIFWRQPSNQLGNTIDYEPLYAERLMVAPLVNTGLELQTKIITTQQKWKEVATLKSISILFTVINKQFLEQLWNSSLVCVEHFKGIYIIQVIHNSVLIINHNKIVKKYIW